MVTLGQDPTQLNLGLGMVVQAFNPRRQIKQISEFKASLEHSKSYVKKSLSAGLVGHTFNPSV